MGAGSNGEGAGTPPVEGTPCTGTWCFLLYALYFGYSATKRRFPCVQRPLCARPVDLSTRRRHSNYCNNCQTDNLDIGGYSLKMCE